MDWINDKYFNKILGMTKNNNSGNNIKLFRTALNLSQKDLAIKMNISAQQIHKYETGIDQISSSKLLQLAEIFNCSVADIIQKSSGNSNDMLQVNEQKSEFKRKKRSEPHSNIIEFVKTFAKLDNEKKQEVIEFVKTIQDKKKKSS